jgi:hypothetical protein
MLWQFCWCDEESKEGATGNSLNSQQKLREREREAALAVPIF